MCCEKIELLNLESAFDIQLRDIYSKVSNSKIMFRGIKTSQGIQTAKLKSLTDVNIWVIDEAEELADLLADNRLSELAELDEDDLRRVLQSISDADPDFDIDNIPLDDAATFGLLGRGDTIGVFQLESTPMQQLLRLMRPSSF
jgi:hypothetical protein